MCKQFNTTKFDPLQTVATYSMNWQGNTITPGDLVRFTERSAEFRFVELRTDVLSGSSWVVARELPSFKIMNFAPKHLRGVIRKRSYQKGRGQ